MPIYNTELHKITYFFIYNGLMLFYISNISPTLYQPQISEYRSSSCIKVTIENVEQFGYQNPPIRDSSLTVLQSDNITFNMTLCKLTYRSSQDYDWDMGGQSLNLEGHKPGTDQVRKQGSELEL